jgi:hypothetical protein
MAIGTRKKGTVVRCPKCAGQMVVPETSESGLGPASASAPPASAPQAAPGSFDVSDVELLARPDEENPFAFAPGEAQQPVSGVFLTAKHLVLAGVLIFVLLFAAFVLGWFLGRPR